MAISACCPLALGKERHAEMDTGTSVAGKAEPSCKTMQLQWGCKQETLAEVLQAVSEMSSRSGLCRPCTLQRHAINSATCQHSLEATSRETTLGLAFSLFLNIWAVTGVKLHQPSNNSDLFECQLCVFLQHWASA